jgi:hypothetical protein
MVKNFVDQGGFTVVNVGNNGNISNRSHEAVEKRRKGTPFPRPPNL